MTASCCLFQGQRRKKKLRLPPMPAALTEHPEGICGVFRSREIRRAVGGGLSRGKALVVPGPRVLQGVMHRSAWRAVGMTQ